MSDILVYVKHSGTWVKPCVYKDGASFVLVLSDGFEYNHLMDAVYAEMGLLPSTHSIVVKYETPFSALPIKITNDSHVKSYLYLRSRDISMSNYHLVINNINNINKQCLLTLI